MPPLSNPRHELVAQFVASGKSYEVAMREAGYSPAVARRGLAHLRQASAKVSARIEEFLAAQAAARLVSANQIHERLSDAFNADFLDIINEAGEYKHPKEWPKIWRQMLTGADVKEIFERSRDGGDSSWDKIGRVVKLRWEGMLDIAKQIGMLKPVDAFVAQKQELHLHAHLHQQITERLQGALQREESFAIEAKLIEEE